jgi:hypothetical protein
MAGSKSDYLENKILDGVLGGSAFSLPANVYIALSTATYSDAATGSSMTEVSGSGYARVAVTNNNTSWPAASSGVKANGVVFTFPAATGSWGTVQSFYIVDASSAGNNLYGADLTTARAIASGDTASFAVSSISISEN